MLRAVGAGNFGPEVYADYHQLLLGEVPVSRVALRTSRKAVTFGDGKIVGLKPKIEKPHFLLQS